MTDHSDSIAPSRPIAGLLVTQFLGAFNDHAWKLIVALLGMRAIGGDDLESASMAQTTLAFVVFTVPLMLFSLPAGVLADRISKRSVIIAMKALEVVLMAAATLVLLLQPAGGTAALVVLGLMGVQSALFSPAKYGILPELLSHGSLSEGNARLEMWTFLAIIGGTAAGGLLLGLAGGAVWLAGGVLAGLAVAGLVASLRVPRVAPARSSGGFADTVAGAWRAVRADRALWLTLVGQTFFWATASLLSQVILVYSKTTLDLGETIVALPLAILIIGMGAGSRIAGRLSRDKVEVGLIPWGGLLLGMATLAFGWIGPGLGMACVLLIVFGLASGLMLVPLDALLQWRAPSDRRGAVIALTNVFVFAGVIAGSLGAQGLSSAGLDARAILAGASLLIVVATFWSIRIMPIAFLRMLALFLTNTFYRQRVIGIDNVPEKGGALLVPNHVSYMDGVFIAAAIDRPVRFVVDAEYYDKPLTRLLLKPLGAIPIAIDQGPKATLRALKKAGEYLDEGDVVCVFAEGQITRNGMLLPFKRGLERIVKGRTVPVIPVFLHGLWGSIFSFEGNRFVRKLPKRFPYPVTVAFGAPLPATTSFQEVRMAVQELGERAWSATRGTEKPLHHGLVRTARRHPLRHAFSDPTGKRVNWFRALTGAVALARDLRETWRGQDHVGILLPPSVGAALVNLAASLQGRTSVNLNYTTGAEGLRSAVKQAGLRTLVTNREFVAKAKLELPDDVEIVWIEDVAPRITRGARLKAMVLAAVAPVRALERACGAERRVKGNDVATVIFSSGSTGEPKGVMLTHANIGANLAGAAQVFRFARDDRVLGILPLFHSFGYLVLWVGATCGIGIAFAPNPLDVACVGTIVQRERCTILIATPTFLQLYVKRVPPAQFGSLRLVVAGAEKLTERVARGFEDAFGVRPLEGYGTTECAPVVAASAPDFRAAGFFQPGSRRGSVGQPLPGVSVRVVDPDSFAPLPAGESGLLIVRGPNVMKGYLGKPELTAAAMHDDWYVTGDIATIDEDGFLAITDRLARFAKIGGEMVPHGRVEEALHDAAGIETQAFAVTSIPDEKKGERLAVLHTLADDELGFVLERLEDGDLPNLFRPKRADFVRVDELPVLGTGKLDLRAIRRAATEALGEVLSGA